MSPKEKLEVIHTWTHKFLIENHDHHASRGRFLGRVVVFGGSAYVVTDYTDYYYTEEGVINEAYDLVKENLWILVSQHP